VGSNYELRIPNYEWDLDHGKHFNPGIDGKGYGLWVKSYEE
jgi:hypothetical protein